jgi:hypothetical protein
MKKLLNSVLITVGCFSISACHADMTRTYLLTHPEQLKKEIEVCHEPGSQTAEHNNYCEMVMSAADQFIKMLNEQQRDPENFGMRVMDAQIACAGKKQALDDAQQHLDYLLEQRALPEEMNKATETVNKANADYLASKLQVEILQAVIGVNSPE